MVPWNDGLNLGGQLSIRVIGNDIDGTRANGLHQQDSQTGQMVLLVGWFQLIIYERMYLYENIPRVFPKDGTHG
jgi:hypothetical protein